MRRQMFLPIFFVCLGFVGLLFLLGKFGFLSFFQNTVQYAFFPLSAVVRHVPPAANTQVEKLQKENQMLIQQMADMEKLQNDNKALRDQFQTENPTSKNLLPATIVGMSNSIPNISFPQTLIVDKGMKDGVVKGMVVVEDNFLIGIVGTVSRNFSEVLLTTSKASSLSVKDVQSNAIGVAKGEGDGRILVDNVLLSDQLANNDIIVSLGSQTIAGKGIPAGLILGKIISVNKNPSSLFQSAQVTMLLEVDHLSRVFISLQ